MKRPFRMMSMFAAALLAGAAAPAAMAGNEIVKCIDAGGHVTLTDQPCEPGTATVKLSAETTLPQRHVVAPTELRRESLKRPQTPAQTPAQAPAQPAPLSRDVATLKAARRTLMLQEARPSLARLD